MPSPRTSSRRRTLSAALLLVASVALAACGSSGSAATSPATTGPGGTTPATGTVTVLAAASLTDAFGAEAKAFEATNPGVHVQTSFAASSTLAAQIEQGAPADVYASADNAQMDRLVSKSLVETPQVFAHNSLQIIVRPGNPKGITSLADLAKPGVVYVTAAPAVPIGAYAAQALKKAGVTVTPASQEADVKGIVTKVTSGEADAGIVYATDVTAAGKAAQGVAIPAAYDVRATYPVAVVRDAPNRSAGQSFVDFLLSAPGQRILASYGFGPA